MLPENPDAVRALQSGPFLQPADGGYELRHDPAGEQRDCLLRAVSGRAAACVAARSAARAGAVAGAADAVAAALSLQHAQLDFGAAADRRAGGERDDGALGGFSAPHA